MPIKLVRVGRIPLGFTAVPPHTSTATAAMPPLTLQQIISISIISETMINAAKEVSVKTKHCPIPCLFAHLLPPATTPVPALWPTHGAEGWGGIFRSLPPRTGMQERLQFSAELVNASSH